MTEKVVIDKITIATSIMPMRIEAQRAAIDSWLKLGFEVVSVNVIGEVDHLQAEFPGVRFAPVVLPETEQRECPNVSINFMLSLLTESSSRVCGIVNSDICFRVGSDFSSFIAESAEHGMVFGSRIDVESDYDEKRYEYCLGFDYFFFDRQLITLFPQTDFYLGLPYWDYWLPMVLLSKGVIVKRLISSVAYHVKHYSSWEQHLELFGARFIGSLKGLLLENPSALLLSDRLLGALEANEMDNCSEIVHFILRHSVQSLLYPQDNNERNCVTINAAAFADMKSKLLFYDKLLAESQRTLAAVYASSSWRITEPLRLLKSKF